MFRFGNEVVVLATVLAGLMSGGQTRAAAPPMRAVPGSQGLAARGFTSETLALMQGIKELDVKIMQARRTLTSDTKTVAMQKAVDKARAAYDAKLKEALGSTTETAQIEQELQKILEQLRDRSTTLEKRRELARENRQLAMRLRAVRGKARSQPEVAALAEELQKASRALEDRVREVLKANPQTRPLIEKREQMQKKLQAAMKRRAQGARPPAPGAAPAPPPPPAK